MKNSVLTFLSKTFSSGKEVDPVWLACMPVVNCLEGRLQPFVPLDLSHFEIIHTQDAKWWCYTELERVKEEMKRNQWTV